MTRPTKHPKTGVYQVRKAIPLHLREAAKRSFGVSRELKVSLRTKDERQALRTYPAALAEIEAKLEGLRAAAEGRTQALTERQVKALAGHWYAAEHAKHQDDPGTPEQWENAAYGVGEQADQIIPLSDDPVSPEHDRAVTLSDDDRADAQRVLLDAGLQLNAESIDRVGHAIWRARLMLYPVLERIAEGDWSPDTNLAKFPTLPVSPPSERQVVPVSPPGLTFEALLNAWALEQGFRVDAIPIPRPFYDRKRTILRLAEFLGHSDATKVTAHDGVRWKEEMQSRGLSPLTVRNDLSEMSALWKHALANQKLGPQGVNPFAGISPPKPKSRKKQRRAFTQDEAVAILTAARAQKGYMRWLPWVCCLTGGRLSEICQASTDDVLLIDGVHMLRIDDEGLDDDDDVRSIKNEDSRRNIPIHPALVAEGFLAYVGGLPARSPLFPDAKPDKMFGRRSTIAGRKISRWMKEELKLTDRRISPNHSWRHWFTDACRKVSMHPEVRSALTGHSARMDESDNYGDGMGQFVHVLAKAIAEVPSPLPPPPLGAQ